MNTLSDISSSLILSEPVPLVSSGMSGPFRIVSGIAFSKASYWIILLRTPMLAFHLKANHSWVSPLSSPSTRTSSAPFRRGGTAGSLCLMI
jgi:hypothetical protein